MGQYDSARRKQARRAGRERGAWVYVPAVELEAAGIDPKAEPPFYRLYGKKGNKRTVLVQLYEEP